MVIRENEPLALHTTFRVGGPARFFIEALDEEDAIEAVRFAKDRELPLHILGGGSNTLFRDTGFPGVVLSVAIPGIEYTDTETEEKILLEVGAGVPWDAFVEESVLRGLWGLENLSYIPGLVGAAPIQNIGAYGVEAKDTIVSVTVLDTRTLEIKKMKSDECSFDYRTSVFKSKEGKYLIVLRVSFLLSREGTPNLSYAGLKDRLNGQLPSISDIREAVIAIRKEKLPDVSIVGTAGSFFKNPMLRKADFEGLQKLFPDIKALSTGENGIKISAAWLIEHVGGFKGRRQGGASVSPKHALVIVNEGSASADDILTLSSSIQKKIFSETKIMLESEVVIVE